MEYKERERERSREREIERQRQRDIIYFIYYVWIIYDLEMRD